MKNLRLWLSFGFGLSLLMGCSSGEATPTPGISVTVFVPTPAPTNTARPAPPPTPKPAPTVAPGAAVANTNPITPNTASANDPAGLVVTNDFVNVRKGPDVRYDFLGRLEKGAKANVIGKSGNALWWQIEFAGGKGWVINDFVQANPAAQNAKVIAVESLPTEVPTAVQVIDLVALTTSSPAATAVPTAPPPPPGPTDDGCSPSDPNWRGRDPSYPFCVRHDLEWQNGDGGDRPTLYWDIYGVQSIELRIEGFSQGGGRYPVAYAGQFTVNRKELEGCGKAELYVTRKDGQTVGYNEKFFCR